MGRFTPARALLAASLAGLARGANCTIADVNLTIASNFGLAFDLSFILSPSDATDAAAVPVTVTWARSDGVGDEIAQTLHAAADGVTATTARLFRFAPDTEYEFSLTTGDGASAIATVTSGRTGAMQYDSPAPFATVTGTPSWEMTVADFQERGEVGRSVGMHVFYNGTGCRLRYWRHPLDSRGRKTTITCRMNDAAPQKGSRISRCGSRR